MKKPDTSAPPSADDANGSASELPVQRDVFKRWILIAGFSLLVGLAFQTYQLFKLRRELETLSAESVRFGQAVEIFNPAWGTVIDAVDPARFPSRDARDPRYGALVQQYMPRGNAAQTWQLRSPSNRTGSDASLPVEAYLKHGFAFLNARDFNRAVQAFEHCVDLYPNTAAAHNGLAMALRDKAEFAGALSSHDQAIALEPEHHQFRWERAVPRLRAGDADGAIEDSKKTTEQDAAFADAYNTLGMAYRRKRDYAEALKNHDRAVDLNPDREDFWRERALTHQANGDQEKSAADLTRARAVREGRN